MSCYTSAGKKPRYRLSLGFDASAPLPGLFAAVSDLGWRTDGRVLEESGQVIVRLGGSNPPLLNLQMLVSALAPYGQVPLSTQLQLLAEIDATRPFPLIALGKELVAIGRQSPHARLDLEPPDDERVFVLLNEQGWQMLPWSVLGETEPKQAFAHLLFKDRPDVTLETPSAYLQGDPSVLCYLDDYSSWEELPVYALCTRGTALCGPVALANESLGLTAEQVGIVRQEVFFVEEAIRDQVSKLWYQAWNTVAGRGW